jgi:WD40 repeat protein
MYSFWDCQKLKIPTFKGHSGKVTGLSFQHNDSILYSCGIDGIVYEWNLLTG